jgi:alanyl-tRNA synthetase
MEEERFAATIDAGLNILNTMIADTKDAGKTVLSGDDTFKLYDTYGFPVDLTREIAEEAGLAIDNERFTALMQEQRTRAREARANISGWANASGSLLADLPKTEFVGYTEDACEAKVVAIIVEDGLVDQVSEGEFTLILDKTPCYGEGGGQIGDEGSICANGMAVSVLDTKKTDGIYLHMCSTDSAVVRVGDVVKVSINTERRAAIMRNHSAAHLLQNALRAVLGDHVEQAGSYVSDTVCRFDFTHFSALSADEIAQVEALVNAEILSAGEGSMTEMPIDEAKKLGAMALFGEKYGKMVRVVRMGSKSIELCGGTHVDNTGKIGLFKIVGESSVAAGVRRIEAVTGTGVLALLAGKDALLHEVARELKVPNVSDVAKKATALQGEIANAKKEIEALNAKLAGGKLDAILASAVDVNGVMLVAARAEGMNVDMARTLVDDIKAKHENAVVVLAVEADGKLNFLAGAGKDAVAKGAHAGKLVGAVAAVTGGKGGGRPDNAMAGGRDASQIDAALTSAKATLEGMIK